MKGYNNRIVRINLSRGEVKYVKIGNDILKKFIGGKGLGYYLVYKEVPPGTNAFDPSNKIIFVPGAFSGLIPGASKVAVVSISPETGLINDSYAGDRFGPMLKRAGFNALIVEGKSKGAVYLHVAKNKVEIVNASSIWGKGIYETTEILWREYENLPVVAIGPAGENLVRFAK